jgi:hypothetical protein
MIKELQLETSQASQKPFAKTNYDATLCYNRIVPNLAILASRKFGVPKEVAAMDADTLRQAEYRIRTDVGLATTRYSHAANHPIYGAVREAPIPWPSGGALYQASFLTVISRPRTQLHTALQIPSVK